MLINSPNNLITNVSKIGTKSDLTKANIVSIRYFMGWSKEDIREFRKEFELTQKELGNFLGVSQNYIFMLEGGLRKPGKPLMLLLDCVKEKLIQKRKGVKK
jgi:DNA-binding transcriptional regulator YiaG